MEQGIVYPAMGEPFISEVRDSIDTLRDFLPSFPVTVISDRHLDIDKNTEVRVINDPAYDYSDSIIDLDIVPYDKVLQLDTDTYINSNISGMYDVLDEFDFGAAINPGKRHYAPGDDTYVPQEIPKAFPLFNSGVLLYEKNQRVRDLFTEWTAIYERTKDENAQKFNQPALRQALFYSDVRIYPLPPEYNCHTLKPGTVVGEVKIVHARHPAIERIVAKLNETSKPRCFTNTRYPISVTVGPSYGEASIYYKARMVLASDGFTGLLSHGLDNLLPGR